jgi:membrane complex biogenesis BtpA family protein
MEKFKDYIRGKKFLVGMVHVKALPGTPENKLSSQEIIDEAIKEAKVFKKLGVNILAIENMHDIPYTKKVGPEITALMTLVGKEIKKLGVYCGIQILAGANKEALAAAKAADLDFIRAEGFVFAHVADEGYIESCAGELLRYRKQIGAENILVFTDIKKKHSAHAITSDVSIAETAHAAEFFLSDGVIVTGVSTGTEADLGEVEQVKKAVHIPVLIGSGITPENLKNYFEHADIFIVGSYIKKKGYWKNDLDEERISKLVKEINRLNKKQ